MVFRLYGICRSPWVRLVAATSQEKQVPFELVYVDLANGEPNQLKLPEYPARTPLAKFLTLYVFPLTIFWFP